jgi:homoprotocatechuate degradation regulator HpaR
MVSSNSGSRSLPPFEQTISAVLIEAKEAVIAPLRLILRDYGITEPQWRVLRVINDRAPTDATGIAEVGLLRAPSVTRILKELEQRKLIVREPDGQDRRRTLVVLSAEGRDVVKATSRAMLKVLSDYSGRFGAERLERLAGELRALSATLKSKG